ncbi:hypothetical protein BDW69DRAFT_139708 [Aspergillus filifer]
MQFGPQTPGHRSFKSKPTSCNQKPAKMSFNPDRDHPSDHDMLFLLYDDIAQLADITNSIEPPPPYISHEDRYTALRRAIIEHSVEHIKLWCEEMAEIGQDVMGRSVTETLASPHHSNPADDLDKELSPSDHLPVRTMSPTPKTMSIALIRI